MKANVRVESDSFDNLDAYESVSIAFEVNSRLSLAGLLDPSMPQFLEEPMPRRFKDYDADAAERPSSLPGRFDVAGWRAFAAFEGSRRVGGIIVGHDSPTFGMLRGDPATAVIVDLRVDARFRGQGVGAALLSAGVVWATSRDFSELIVETQDVNVAACRFYSSNGFRIVSVEPRGYGAEILEAKLIWRLPISKGVH